MKKIYDLAVKTGSYTNSSGEEKGRYQNIGSIMEKDDGGKFIFIERSFNPAGVPFKEGASSIIVSMFKPKSKDEFSEPTPAAGETKSPMNDDDIPF